MSLGIRVFTADLFDVIGQSQRKPHSFDRLGIALISIVFAFLDEVDLCGPIPLVSHQFHEITLNDDLWLAVLQRILASWPVHVRDSFLKIERKLSNRKKMLLIKRTRCKFCGRQCTSKVALGKVGLDALESLRLRICTKCQPKLLITKSFARSHYLVTDKALDKLPAARKSWYGKKCKLYFQPSVRQISMQRWKSEEILERERENRRPFDRSNPSLPPWKRLAKPKPHEPTPSALAGGLPAICNELSLYPKAAPAMVLDPYPAYQAPAPQAAYSDPSQYHHLRLVSNTLPPPSLILTHPGYGEPVPKGLPRQNSNELLWGTVEEDYWSSSEMFND